MPCIFAHWRSWIFKIFQTKSFLNKQMTQRNDDMKRIWLFWFSAVITKVSAVTRLHKGHGHGRSFIWHRPRIEIWPCPRIQGRNPNFMVNHHFPVFSYKHCHLGYTLFSDKNDKKIGITLLCNGHFKVTKHGLIARIRIPQHSRVLY